MNKTPTPFNYRIIIKDISEGRGEAFEAFVPAFNAHNFGDTPEEAIESYKIYFEDEVKRRKEENIAMPASDIVDKEKQVPLRIKLTLYQDISELAKSKGLSFNRFVSNVLEGVL